MKIIVGLTLMVSGLGVIGLGVRLIYLVARSMKEEEV